MSSSNWRDLWRARRADAGVLSSILLFFMLFFGWTAVAGRFLVAADAYYYSYPLRTVAWRSIRDGALPLWTPFVMAGYPLLAMSQLGVGYPLTWGYLFLPAHLAEELYILAPFLLAPAFTYAYARELGRSPLAALLAGLSFTYGGMMLSKLGVIGTPTNSAMWLPLVLLAVERARTRRLVPCLLLSTGAFAMSVLNGHGQSFLYVGLVATSYAAFVSATAVARERRDSSRGDGNGLSVGRAWRPLVVAFGGLALSLGLAAFQILETMRAVRRSVRSTLAYEVFSAGAFTPLVTLKSFLAPVYHYVEVSSYMPPLAFALAVFGGICALRRREGRDARVFYWMLVVGVSYILMLGASTPLNALLYHVPIYNGFRYPSRHAFEWTFAISILSAYGWDALKPRSERVNDGVVNDARVNDRPHRRSRRLDARLAALVALALSLLAGACWWRAVGQPPTALAGPDTGFGTGLAEGTYIFWKLGFTLLVCVAAWQSWRVAAARWRAGLLLCAIMAACFVEPFIMASTWWFPDAKPASRFVNASPAMRLLRAYPPETHRVYTRVNLYLVPGYPPAPPPLELPNLHALDGIHNVAGYEQLVLERFSRALGNVGPDAVNLRYDVRGTPDASVFADRSHVLDLLNTSFVVTFANLSPAPAREGQAAPPSAAAPPPNLSPERWETMLDRDGVMVLRNRRAQPRAWLVAEAEAVDGEEALRRIRGEGGRGDGAPEFAPRRTALLEVRADELPNLPGGALAPESTIRLISYEPTHLTLETNAPTATVAVISELFYPGWEARVDGVARPIYLTDFLLRGVAVPAGRHRIEMRYRAPAARNGALISLCTLLFVILLPVLARRRPGRGVGLGDYQVGRQ